MAESAAICAVCERLRTRGDYNDAGDVFICAPCQAVAARFIAIQDSIIEEAHQIAEARRNSDDEQHQQGLRRWAATRG